MSTSAHLALAHTVNAYGEMLGKQDLEIKQLKLQLKTLTDENESLKKKLKEGESPSGRRSNPKAPV